jgi:hypothetical protein
MKNIIFAIENILKGFFKKRNCLKIERNVGTAVDLSFLSLLIFLDPIEIRLGSVSVFNSRTF